MEFMHRSRLYCNDKWRSIYSPFRTQCHMNQCDACPRDPSIVNHQNWYQQRLQVLEVDS